ncbi:MAG: LysR family transcriptional regulator [Clostridia bacterium]|nr:LysR family transcriptional regulator [Clostridia bacterium]
MYISYDYYKIFYYVAKCGSFTRAADILLNSQPNLTRAIKTLEQELGCALFERSNKGVRLTEAGERLFLHVSVAVEHLQAAEAEISQNQHLWRGMISLGATEIALRCFLLPILNRFSTKYPSVRIKISNISAPQALSMLKSNLIDLAVVTTPIELSSELSHRTLREFSEIAVGGDAYLHLANGAPLTLKELAEYPIISLGKQTATYEFYLHEFMREQIPFYADIEAATADQILPLVQHNMGIGFIPEAFLDKHTDRCHQIPLASQLPPREICLVKRKKHSLPPPAAELERMILEEKDG